MRVAPFTPSRACRGFGGRLSPAGVPLRLGVIGGERGDVAAFLLADSPAKIVNNDEMAGLAEIVPRRAAKSIAVACCPIWQ